MSGNSSVWKCVFIFVLVLQITKRFEAQEISCCSQAAGSCRNLCDKISLVNIAADSHLYNETVLNVQKYCSLQLVEFWNCINATFRDISRGSKWSGRLCCPIIHSETCRRACVTATGFIDLTANCRRSDEMAFFSCLERQAYGDECCSNSINQGCRAACQSIFHSRLTPTRYERNYVMEQCNMSGRVLSCLQNITKVTPLSNVQKHMRCCDRSNKSKCREACKSVLSTTTTLQEIIDGLQFGGCGPPLFQDPFWQCFLRPIEPVAVQTSFEISRIDRVGMDSAKWHCCSRASTNECRKLCSKTFTKDWLSLSDEFHLKCLNHVAEEHLRNCLDEVDEPCELGCDGLSFCTNFNNRPTELFRACTVQSDEEARHEVSIWQTKREIQLPGLTLPLKNIEKCSPNLWKALACTLKVRPCSRNAHANQICRHVCLDILTECVDWIRISIKHSAETICDTLSPDNPNESCVTLDEFLTPAPFNYPRLDDQVSSPCKGEPCESHEICRINKNCPPGTNCRPYTCVSSCRLGEVSEYAVPDGTYVRIPSPNNPKGCLKICKCVKGKIEQCQPLPCLLLSSCWMGNNFQIGHGSNFDLECNKCSCYAGEVICSRRQCANNTLTGRNTAYTTLPCNCPPHFMPVCGRNGKVYPSTCLAKCAGLGDGDIDYEPCNDPCRDNPCAVGQKCVPEPKVCLSLMHKPCSQHICVSGTANCNLQSRNPVCDVNNKQHANACFLAHNNEKFAYSGPCLRNCKHRGEVCGFNGRSYWSECAAYADFVVVDYIGPCIAVGLIADTKKDQCDNVVCQPLPDNCLGVTPPGACCPKCGGALRMLYSRKQIDRALYLLQAKSSTSTLPLTLKSLLAALERQIQVAQCTVRGFVTVELDLFVMVVSTEKRPSALQFEACVREAEKLATLVNLQGPRIASELILSSLLSAFILHTTGNTASCSVQMIRSIGLIFLIVLTRML